jgi:hypothetical protein
MQLIQYICLLALLSHYPALRDQQTSNEDTLLGTNYVLALLAHYTALREQNHNVHYTDALQGTKCVHAFYLIQNMQLQIYHHHTIAYSYFAGQLAWLQG